MKSVSKLRHIQESNLRLEKRYLMEQPQSGTTEFVKQEIELMEKKEKEKINNIIESLIENYGFNKDSIGYFKRDNVKLITDGIYLYYLSAPVGKSVQQIYKFEDEF